MHAVKGNGTSITYCRGKGSVIGDITDKSAECFSGHLVALDHEFDCKYTMYP